MCTENTAAPDEVKPSLRAGLHQNVRAAFVAKGTSLRAWCLSSSVTRQYAERCLRFQSNGPAAAALRRRIVEAAGLSEQPTNGEASPGAAEAGLR